MRNSCLLLFAIVSFFSESLAQKTQSGVRSWPIPDVPGLLFYIQRDPDVNTVVYSLNLDESGEIRHDNPVNIFWIKYTQGGIHKPLNLLQKDLAYGLTVKPKEPGVYELKSVAFSKMEMLMQKGIDNQYHVHVKLGQRECALKRVFIHITGGSRLHPDIAYMEFHGTEFQTGKPISERIIPD